MTMKSTVGRLFFATALVASGIQQLILRDFVRLVPPLPGWIPGHSFWACLVGVVLTATGVALGTGYKARAAAAVVGALILLSFLCLQLPQALADPLTGFLWTNPCKALALLGGVILLGARAGGGEGLSALGRFFAKLVPLAPVLMGGFLLLGGVQHFAYADFVAKLVPAWIPQPHFWVYLTGIALIAGGVGIILPKTARLAATMSGIMILLWVILLHIPRALADLSDAGETSGIFEALALSGVAFLLAGRSSEPTSEP
jgi:uncharacterized membrane protein